MYPYTYTSARILSVSFSELFVEPMHHYRRSTADWAVWRAKCLSWAPKPPRGSCMLTEQGWFKQQQCQKSVKSIPPKFFFQGPLQKVAMRSDELPVVLDPIEVGCHCYYWVIGDYELTHY